MFKIAAILTSAAMLCTGTLLAAAPEASAACTEPAQAVQRCTVQRHAYIRICGDWWEIPVLPGEELLALPPEEETPPAEEAPPQETPDEERAQEIAQSFSHTRPDGSSCFTILEEFGVSYRAAGENIAMGQRTPEEVMDGWMNSSGHRANILNGTFTSIGVGYYVDGAGAAHWVQIFQA